MQHLFAHNKWLIIGKNYDAPKVTYLSDVVDSKSVICYYWYNVNITIDVNKEKLVI